MSSHGNNGNNLDLMINSRRELTPTYITGDAWLSVRKLIDSVSSITIIDAYDLPTSVKVKDLITVYKWLPQLCHIATFLPVFTNIVNNGVVLVEDVPKFDSLMYKVMGELACPE